MIQSGSSGDQSCWWENPLNMLSTGHEMAVSDPRRRLAGAQARLDMRDGVHYA